MRLAPAPEDTPIAVHGRRTRARQWTRESRMKNFVAITWFSAMALVAHPLAALESQRYRLVGCRRYQQFVTDISSQ
jgi:hypothetical protein